MRCQGTDLPLLDHEHAVQIVDVREHELQILLLPGVPQISRAASSENRIVRSVGVALKDLVRWDRP